MAKLTDRQRKQIIAEYAGGGISQRELAERYQVTQKTISKILNTEEVYQKVSEKKEENTRSMLAFLDSRKEKAQSLMDAILDSARSDIKKAPLRDKMGAFKILSESFGGKNGESKDQTITEHLKLMRDAFARQTREKAVEDDGDE